MSATACIDDSKSRNKQDLRVSLVLRWEGRVPERAQRCLRYKVVTIASEDVLEDVWRFL